MASTKMSINTHDVTEICTQGTKLAGCRLTNTRGMLFHRLKTSVQLRTKVKELTFDLVYQAPYNNS